MDYITEIKKVAGVLSHLSPEVRQHSTLTVPIAQCVNHLLDIVDDMQKPAETAEAPKE